MSECSKMVPVMGDRLSLEMAKNKIKAEKLSEATGVPAQFIRKHAGGLHPMSVESLVKICAYFKVSMDYMCAMDLLEG